MGIQLYISFFVTPLVLTYLIDSLGDSNEIIVSDDLIGKLDSIVPFVKKRLQRERAHIIVFLIYPQRLEKVFIVEFPFKARDFKMEKETNGTGRRIAQETP